MAANPRQDILEPSEGIDSDALARGREAPQHRAGFAAFVTAEEHPAVAPHSHVADRAFGGVIVDGQISVLAIVGQRGPVLQRVSHGPALGTFRQYLRLDLK